MIRRWWWVGVLGVLATALFIVVVQAQATPCREAGPWRCGAAMPTARSEMQAAALDGRVYVAGGLGPGGTTLRAFEAYHAASDSWQRLAPLPVGLNHAAMAALEGQVYVGGGYAGPLLNNATARLWAYDPTTDSWREVASMPGRRAAHLLLAAAGRLWVVGGVGEDAEQLWSYDPAADTWEVVPAPLPTVREHLAGGVAGERLLVVGGRLRENLDTLEIFDPAGGWQSGPPLPTPRGGLTAAVVAGRLHVTGGEAFDPGRTFAEHEVFDPQTNRWTTAEPLPVARHGLASAAVDGRWYVIGGATRPGAGTLVSLSDIVHIFVVDE